MGDAACDDAQAFKLLRVQRLVLGLPPLFLGPLLFGYVPQKPDIMGDFADGVVIRNGNILYSAEVAIGMFELVFSFPPRDFRCQVDRITFPKPYSHGRLPGLGSDAGPVGEVAREMFGCVTELLGDIG